MRKTQRKIITETFLKNGIRFNICLFKYTDSFVKLYKELEIGYYHSLKTPQSWLKNSAIVSFFKTLLCVLISW